MTTAVARDGSPTLRRLTGEKRRLQLVEVATQLFAARGYRSTTMDDVAEAAGVTKPLLYQHFSSKKSLYLELVDAASFRLLADIGEATSAAKGPREQVELGLRAYFRLLVEDPAAFRLLFDRDHGDDEELDRAVRRFETALVEAIDPLIDAGLDDDHRLLLAAALVGMTEGSSIAWMSSPAPGLLTSPEERAEEAERLARRVGALLWAGLRSVQAD